MRNGLMVLPVKTFSRNEFQPLILRLCAVLSQCMWLLCVIFQCFHPRKDSFNDVKYLAVPEDKAESTFQEHVEPLIKLYYISVIH